MGQIGGQVAPLANYEHRRQRPRPDGAALMRYVLFFCLKPLLLAGAGCGGAVGAGAGSNAGLEALIRWRFTGR